MNTLSPPTTQSRLLFRRQLDHLALALAPLKSVSCGSAHPSFPATILHYNLLTEAQLDALAHFYHQSTPTYVSYHYPAPVIHRWSKEADVTDKRRRFGRFIGIRHCESPCVVAVGEEERTREAEQEKMERVVEEELRRRIAREDEREMWRAKGVWM